MTKKELIDRVGFILDETKTAVLATTSENGVPHMRWMSPGLLPSHPGILYAVTSPHLVKAIELEKCPEVEWMFQTRSLNEVIILHGKINLIDNPSLKAEVIEAIGKRLHRFWKTDEEETDFIVLETVICEGIHYFPMKGMKEILSF